MDVSVISQSGNVRRLDSLDLMRGLAAFAVLAGHARAYTFQSFGEILAAGHQPGVLAKTFYFLTALGHEAVVVFFALSGFLVGGKAFADLTADRFSWPAYMLRRLTRLWIVIVPSLAMTFAFDQAGLRLTGGAGYDGRYNTLYAFGAEGVGVVHGFVALLGNLAFVQTICTPVFGSDFPMWSLANEFWYYVFFPLLLWIFLARAGFAARAAGCCVLFAMCAFLPFWLLEGGAIWAAGAAAAWASRRQTWRAAVTSFPARALALLSLLAIFPASRAVPGGVGDLAMGLVIAASLPVVANLPPLGRIAGGLARASSEISYTLYLTHFPLLTFVALSFMAPARLPPGPAAFALFAALMSVCVAWAGVSWWCFESRTDRIYAALSARLPSARKPAPVS